MAVSIWKLQDAKARFSEVVRRARSEGPQHVTVHGRGGVVIVSEDEFARLKHPAKEMRTGAALIEALRDPRFRGFSVERERLYSPVRATPVFDDSESDR